MANKRRSDDDVERMLHEVLGRYQDTLFSAANSKRGESRAQYQKRFFKALDGAAITARQATQNIIDRYLPSFDAPVSELLKSFGAKYGGEEVKLTTYVRIVNMMTESVEQYKDKLNGEIISREKSGKVTTVTDLREMINTDLKNDDVTVVRYANGAKMPVDKYAAMLARTSRSETENLAMIQQALREGLDIVECDTIYPTCDICAVYQNRRYSISGKSSQYPALYKTAFKSGYSIMHPNCRHSWSPVHEEMYTEEENREMLDSTHRSWAPDRNGVNFQQAEKARAEYARGEQLMRKWNAELVDYERLKAYYKEKGEEPPYKSLGAYRREVRKPPEKQSPTIRGWKNRKRDELQYERWKKAVGKNNISETLEKFQQMKYNKDKQKEFELLKGYKEAQEKQDIYTLVSFEVYKEVSREIDRVLVGKTFDGIEIKGKKTHFIDRIIGQYQESDYPQHGKRQGVKVEDALYALSNPLEKQKRQNPDGTISLTFVSQKCKVTINPDTGMLIQTNPNTRRSSK